MDRENEFGALWWKKGTKGAFLSGHIIIDGVKIPIVCFEKRNKKNEKQPDFDILKSDPDWKAKKDAAVASSGEDKQGFERHQEVEGDLPDDGDIPF